MTLAMELARFVVTHPSDRIPDVALERAEMIIASTLASVAVGVDIESARIIRDLEKENGGVCDATVWFDSARLPLSAAAKANAVASDAAASDDSDMRCIAHIGTIVSTWALPIFINNYGISNTMLMGAGISLFGLLISVAFAPETRGMSLAQTSNMTIRGQRMG